MMATAPEKPATPAYTSYKPLVTWLNGFRDDKHIPLRVDKSHLPKASGSVQAGHMAALKFLKLIDGNGKPTELFERFVMADDGARAAILAAMLKDSYSFLFAEADFDLARASSKMLEEKFRACDIKGSALQRAVSFFLAAAKDAGVKLAPGLKAPPSPPRTEKKSNGSGKPAAEPDGDDDEDDDSDDKKDDPQALKFEIPIPVNRKVKISIPADFNEDDWDLLQTMFSAYVKRWKGFAAKASKEGGT
jgi:hypothetical protein